MRRKYNDLLAKRAGMLAEAETLLKDGKREDYKSKMAEIGNINDEITEVKAFIDEQDRQFLERKDDPGEAKDKAAERGNTLMKGGSIALSAQEVRKGLYPDGLHQPPERCVRLRCAGGRNDRGRLRRAGGLHL